MFARGKRKVKVNEWKKARAIQRVKYPRGKKESVTHKIRSHV